MASRSDELLLAAQQTFADLSSVEQELVRATALGEGLDLGAESPWSSDDDNADRGPRAWGPERGVRAALIRWLCIDSRAAGLVDATGLRISAARIIGDLGLDYVTLHFPLALRRCRISGKTSLVGAILPVLDLSGSWTGPIDANGVNIDQAMFLSAGFRSDGLVSLYDAKIGGNLDCTEGTFNGDGDVAIEAEILQVGGDIRMRADTKYTGEPTAFKARGVVRLIGAQVAGDITFVGGEFVNPLRRSAIQLNRSVVKGGIYIHDGSGNQGGPGPKFRAEGLVDFSNATTVLLNFAKNSWPEAIRLQGFVYTDLDMTPDATSGETDRRPRNADKVIAWLSLDDSGGTQPYRQAAQVLEDSGDIDAATEVRKRMESMLTNPLARPLKATIGYGYEPANAFWGLLGVGAVGALLYWRADRMRKMAPKDKDAYSAAKAGDSLPSHYPRFNAIIFSLENTFPFVRFGQTEKWQADPDAVDHATPWILRRRTLRWVIWIQVIVGWLLATLFVAGISGIVRH